MQDDFVNQFNTLLDKEKASLERYIADLHSNLATCLKYKFHLEECLAHAQERFALTNDSLDNIHDIRQIEKKIQDKQA